MESPISGESPATRLLIAKRFLVSCIPYPLQVSSTICTEAR